MVILLNSQRCRGKKSLRHITARASRTLCSGSESDKTLILQFWKFCQRGLLKKLSGILRSATQLFKQVFPGFNRYDAESCR